MHCPHGREVTDRAKSRRFLGRAAMAHVLESTTFLSVLSTLPKFICPIFVWVYAVERFSKLPAVSDDGDHGSVYCSRATTTAAAYRISLSVYCGLILGLYFALVQSHFLPVLAALYPDVNEMSKASPAVPPMELWAVLLTVLLPKVPLLSKVDEWLRTSLQRKAAIPREVRRLAEELGVVDYRFDGEAQSGKLLASLLDEGFERRDLQFDGGPTAEAMWTKLFVLMRRLDAWARDPDFTPFASTCPGDLASLRRRYDQLVPTARKCFALTGQVGEDGGQGPVADIIRAYREDLREQIETLLRSVYETISRATLVCESTQSQRARKLADLGFQIKAPGRLSLNQL